MDDSSTIRGNGHSGRTRPAVNDLVAEFQNLVDALEEVYMAAKDDSSEKVSEWRAEAEVTLERAREKLGEFRSSANERAKKLYADSDHYVHENPWTAVGVGAGIGLIIGLMIGRR